MFVERKPRGLGVRTRSGSDGIDHSSCALIGSLPLAVLTQRCARTSELTRRRESKHPSPAPSKLRTTLPPLASNEVICLESLRKKGSSLLKFAADYQP